MSQGSELDDSVRPLSCLHCNANFKRKEHLDRHLQRHSGLRPFECSLCKRSFSRKDTLARHMTVHGSEVPQRPLLPRDSSRRSAQACLQCAQAKQACKGRDPCNRCLRRNIACEPAHRPTRRRPPSLSVPEPSAPIHHALASLDRHASPSSAERCPESEECGARTPAQELNPATPRISVGVNSEGAISGWPVDHEESSASNLWDIPEGSLTAGERIEDQSWSESGLGFLSSPFRSLAEEGLFVPVYKYSENHGISPVVHAWNLGEDFVLEDGSQETLDLAVSDHQSERQLSTLQEVQLENDYVAATENFGHLNVRFSKQYAEIVSFHNTQSSSSNQDFITDQLFHAFLELYFEHFDYQFPFIHPSTLDHESTSWILLLAIATIGAQYSATPNAANLASSIRALLQNAVKVSLPVWPDCEDLTFVRTVLLLDICMLFGGSRKCHIAAQYNKNVLVTLFRSIKRGVVMEPVRDEGLFGSPPSDRIWQQWLTAESRTRLLYSIYRLQCIELILLDQRPEIDFSDVALNLPCEDSVWSCRTAQAWHRYVISRKIRLSNSEGGPELEKRQQQYFARSIYTMSIYVEERALLDKLRSPPLQELATSVASPGSHQSSSDSTACINPGLFTASIRASIDVKLKHLTSNQRNHERDLNDPFPFLLLLLRQIPLRTIYAFSGWQASDAEIKTAERSLMSWMHSNQSTARMCLWYAAYIFATLRAKYNFACYDALCLLIAMLYIWAFDIIMHGDMSNIAERSGSVIYAQDVLRLDRIRESAAIESWIADGGDIRIHINGVGVLDGKTSPRCILLGLRKILLSQKAWTGLCIGLEKTIVQLLKGQRPEMQP